MKKKIAVLLCVLAMLMVCTMAVAAEDGGEKLWDFWSLLSPENVNYLGILGTLLSTLVTVFRIITGADSLSGVGEWLKNILKNLIPSSK